MPSDITGTDIIQEDPETGRRKHGVHAGSDLRNIVLADEINRTPPKTQSALLEAMQEHRVTVQGRTYPLDEPFFVFATQNPIELEGHVSAAGSAARPLHVQDRDRLPPEDQEVEVVQSTTSIQNHEFRARASPAPDIVAFQRLVRRVPVVGRGARATP